MVYILGAGQKQAANKNKREFVVDDYQDEIIQVIEKDTFNKRVYSFGRCFRYLKNYTATHTETVDNFLTERGFCWLVRTSGAQSDKNRFINYVKKFKDAVIVYSMWSEYKNKDEDVKAFLAKCCLKKFIELHTSGHASTSAINKVHELVRKESTRVMLVHAEPSPQSMASGFEIPKVGVEYTI